MNFKLYQVLLVDDQPLNLKVISDMAVWSPVSQFEIKAQVASGEEALQALEEGGYDLVITDIIMPHVDGIRLLQQIREKHPGIRVILLSGMKNFEYARRGLRHGACDYLVKPVSEKELLTALQRIQQQLEGKDTDLYQDVDFAKEVDRVCVEIRSKQGLSKGTLETYIKALQNRPGFRVLDEQTLGIRGIGLLLSQLGKDYLAQDLMQLSEAFIRRNWGEDGFDGSFRRALASVESVYKELLLPEADHELVRQTIQIVLGYPEMKKTVESIAQMLYVNRSYLSKVFREQCGMTLLEYLVRVKMYRARILLIEPERTISEVAQILGYQDEEYFSKAFKTHGGMLPRDYRKIMMVSTSKNK